jgi:hypothetical protein
MTVVCDQQPAFLGAQAASLDSIELLEVLVTMETACDVRLDGASLSSDPADLARLVAEAMCRNGRHTGTDGTNAG